MPVLLERVVSAPRRLLVRTSVGLSPLRDYLEALGRPSEPAQPYAESRDRVAPRLTRAALLGFLGIALITLGASQPNSPFTYKGVGAWFFGLPHTSSQPTGVPAQPPGTWLFLGVVAVYGGMLLLTRAWYDLVRTTSRHQGVPLSRLVPIFVAWIIPLLIVAPLFSRDLYSYAAQGELMTRHGNPYQLGTYDIGSTPILNLADPLWGHVTSPYGPVFLMLAGWIVSLANHNPIAALFGLRGLALLGTVMFAVAIPFIARTFNRDGATAFVLAALNPLILLHLVGGGHNDALMIGFLAVGYALARRGHPVLGIICCAIGAVVKVPALVGVVYIGWEWLGPNRTPRERIRPVVTAALIAGAVMALLSEGAGLGWGWIGGLTNPDNIRSYLDPATAIGLAAGKVVALVGLGDHTHILLTLARGSALLLAAVIAIRLLLRSDEIGPLKALGWTLVAAAVLGPVVQPWYVTWGFVFLAPVVEGTARRVLCIASAAASFLGLPGGFVLVHELGVANPVLVGLASAALVGLLGVLVVPRVRRANHLRAAARATAGNGLFGGDEQLHQRDVEPAAEFAPDLALDADQLEPARAVEGD